MDLYTVQIIFYSLGILFMVALIALIAALIYVLFQMKTTVETVAELVRDTVQDMRNQTVHKVETFLDENKMKMLGTVGMGVAGFLATQLKNRIFGKKKEA